MKYDIDNEMYYNTKYYILSIVIPTQYFAVFERR